MSATDFTSEQFAAIYPAGIENHYWTLARNLVVADYLRRYSTGPILDVGAGRGVVLDFLLQRNFPIWGVDPAPVPVAPELKSFLFTGQTLGDLATDLKNRIETVLLLDVIEHLERPEDLLADLKNNLPNLKTILITVPARSELWSNYDEFNAHFRRYERASLDTRLSRAGWLPARSAYYFHTLYLPAWLLVRLGKKRGTDILAPQGFSIRLHFILAKLFYWESKILPGSWLGSSLVGAFQRP